MTPKGTEEVSAEVLEEGCYYLTEVGLSAVQIASHFEIKPSKVTRMVKAYAARLKSGEVVPSEFDRVFWENVKKEAEGDEKLTFVSDKGFHHSWKSELQRLDGRALMSIYEASRDFLNTDPNQRFIDFPAPKGYDPLAMNREVKKAVDVIGKLLQEKWEEDRAKSE